MKNTDLGFVADDHLSNEEYKKWTAVKTSNTKKRSIEKHPSLVRKQNKKKKYLRAKDKQYVEDVFLYPEDLNMEKEATKINENTIHIETLKQIPSYEIPPRRSWWDILTFNYRNNIKEEKNIDITNVLKEIN